MEQKHTGYTHVATNFVACDFHGDAPISQEHTGFHVLETLSVVTRVAEHDAPLNLRHKLTFTALQLSCTFQD